MIYNHRWDFYLSNIQSGTQKEILINKIVIDEFFFIESIDNMFLTAELTINDNNGYFESINLTGKETLKVVIRQKFDADENNKTLDIEKQIEFEIFNITLEVKDLTKNFYKFYLVEKGASGFYTNNYCTGFTDKKVSDIIKVILDKHIKISSDDYEIENTSEKINYVIPYVKTSETLLNLIKMARREKTPNEGGFLFYSTLGDKTRKTPLKKFISINSLIKKDTIDMKSDYDIYTYRKHDTNPNFINNFQEIENVNFLNQGIKSIGIGGKNYYGVNYNVDKNIINIKQKYSDFLNKTKLMGERDFFTSEIDNKNDEIDFIGGTKEKVKAYQDYSMRMLLCNYNTKNVIFDGALYRYVGQLIFIEQVAANRDDIINKQDFGYWLIKSITHYYSSGGQFKQKITIIKDSFGE